MSQIPEWVRDLVSRRSGGRCERCRVATATDKAHRKRRREGGHSPANICDLCWTCHRWCHTNPQQAIADGWMISVYDERDPATIPIHHPHGEDEYLAHDGTKRMVKRDEPPGTAEPARSPRTGAAGPLPPRAPGQ